jgi:tetratricopeptide (TPR) repeat protein
MLLSMKPGSRFHYDRDLPVSAKKLRFGLVLLYLFAISATPTQAADSPASDEAKAACCRYEGADLAQLHKSADRLYSQFKPREAVAELLKILHADGNNFEALVKLARAYIDIGDLLPENGANWQERKLKEYTIAQDYARKAMRVDPNSTWSHFWIAAAVGSIAVVSPMSKQVDLSIEIRDEVEKSIALDPKNGSAYHVYGVWHRKVAEIGGASRMFASMLYGKSLPKGSLEKSIEYLKKAVALNPTVIVSRLELARSHAAKSEWPAARALLKSIPELPAQFSDDAKHKQNAAQLLEEIKER